MVLLSGSAEILSDLSSPSAQDAYALRSSEQLMSMGALISLGGTTWKK
ncbi:hypothetical protein PJE062_3657 [Pseudovibrio sp. JE062]|nr:hypothetical protein PJE062_3657 [Pseudovibrio sp. JE062]